MTRTLDKPTAAAMRFDTGLDLTTVDLTREEGQPLTLRIPLLPEGQFEHAVYGQLDWNPTKFATMIQNFDARVTGYVPMLNFDHSACNPMAATAEAAGWFTKLEHEPGQGLFGIVELTDLGEAAIRNKRYRYISSEVANRYARSTGATAENVITGAALTNLPFHDTMPGLFSAKEIPTFDVQSFATLEGDLSFEETRRLLCEAVRAECRLLPSVYRYVRDVFPEFFIYEEYSGEMERYYRRAYTLADGAITLGADAVEVEEVWVTKTRAAFSQARRVTLQLGAGSSAAPKGTPAPSSRGEKRPMSLLDRARKFFRLPETATEDEVTAKFDAAQGSGSGDGAAKPDTPQSQPETLSVPATEFQAMRSQVATLSQRLETAEANQQTAQTALAREKAERAVEVYVSAGKIKPADREEAIAFALESPTRFKQVYDSLPAVIDLKQRGRTGGDDAPAAKQSATGAFLAACRALENQGVDFITASGQVAQEQPELFDAYRAEINGKGA